MRWLGTATHAANNYQLPTGAIIRDSDASRAMANRTSCNYNPTSRSRPSVAQDQPHGSGAKRNQSTAASRVSTWANLAANDAAATAVATVATASQAEAHSAAGGHRRLRSGRIIWCDICGAYSESRGVGLSNKCPGNAAERAADGSINYGGRAQQLRRLRQGVHPTSGQRLTAAIPEHLWPTSSSFDSSEGVDPDADVTMLASSSTGRMRLKLRIRDIQLQGPSDQLQRCERITAALQAHSSDRSVAERQDVAPAITEPPILSERDHLLLNTPLPVPPIYPPGHSGPQPAEWDTLDQQELDAWIAAGRPEVRVDGVPRPGCVNHPWVIYNGLNLLD